MDLKEIKLIVLDVDGTMTDGGIYIDDNGIESKKFNVKDGLGIKLAQDKGIEFLILTGRKSNCVKKRADDLGVKYLAQGIDDKYEYLKNFVTTNNLLPECIAYIGDDLNDLSAMSYVGLSACPIDAVKEVREYCNIVLPQKGGEGVVRTFVDMVLKVNT
jgi:3-deoxy-D-manno-octulosonate 8-phosphate phosphatase (KDO 8-P phosphatase)